MGIPNISIVLPVYNGEKYLKDSVDSALAQGYTDYELIIWNDGSTDKSANLIGSYRDSRIRVFRNNNNQGLFKSLNLAIGKAQGKWIRIWSQDDVMKPNCLETETEFHRVHPEVGMSYCARDIIDGFGKVLLNAPEDKTPEVVLPELAVQIMFYHGSITGNISNVMIKKSVFDEIGLFREDMKISGDFEMWFRILEKYPIGFIREPLIYLRSHKEQFSRLKGMGIIFMREDREIIQSLTERLPPELKPYAKVYNRWNRYIHYVHYMMHNFISGDLKTAVKTYHEIQQVDNPFLVTALWFLTANGRWFKKKPVYITQ